MKTINITEDLEEFNKFFTVVHSERSDVMVWQLDADTQKRNIFHSHISEVSDGDNTLALNTINDEAYVFSSEAVYFYIESKKTIYKSEQISIQNNFLSVKYPDELKMLDEMEDDKLKAVFSAINPKYVKEPPTFHEIAEKGKRGYEFVSGEGRANKKGPDWTKARGGSNPDRIETKMRGKITKRSESDQAFFEKELSYVTLDDEDKKYEGQRNAPRAKPPEGKKIIVQTKDESKPQETLPLYDLSRGGMGFMVFLAEAYSKGEVLNVYGFDDKTFDEPMFAIIRSIRDADELGVEFKVGCQFIDGLQAEEEFEKFSSSKPA